MPSLIPPRVSTSTSLWGGRSYPPYARISCVIRDTFAPCLRGVIWKLFFFLKKSVVWEFFFGHKCSLRVDCWTDERRGLASAYFLPVWLDEPLFATIPFAEDSRGCSNNSRAPKLIKFIKLRYILLWCIIKHCYFIILLYVGHYIIWANNHKQTKY